VANELTPKPSDSMGERARELREKLAEVFGCNGANDEEHARGDCEACNLVSAAQPITDYAIADAFNLGQAGAFEAAAQICLQPKKFTDVCTWKECAEAIRAATPADALAAVEHKVSVARLEEARNVHVVMRGETCGPNCMGCVRIAELQAEAAGK